MIFSWLANLLVLLFFWHFSPPALISASAPVLSFKATAPAVNVDASRSAILQADGRSFLFADRADEAQPIASITKLMTALVFLDNNPDWQAVYKITTDDHVAGGILNLFPGDRVTLRDLFYTSLVASDNGATLALVHASGLNESDFVAKMNAAGQALGLSKTHFADPIGLSNANVSTAREVALLAQAALKRPEIRAATDRPGYDFTTLDGRQKSIDSTDYLLFSPNDGLKILGGKTGYTNEAGYCFVGLFRAQDGREVIVAVLNSSDKNGRFLDSRDLVKWVFANYSWPGRN